jgi:heptaprenyl diphosphate synthase
LLVQVGAAVELGYLAALAQTSVSDEPARSDAAPADSSANWGNMFALMVSDFLLSKAYALSAQVATEVSREIATGLSRACEGYTRALRNAYNPDLSPDEHLDILAQKTATLFALPCRLGARLCGLPVAQINMLATYGEHLGLAFQISDDVLALSGENSQMGQATTSRLDDGVYSLPILIALQSRARDDMRTVLERIRRGVAEPGDAYRIVRETGSVEEALQIAQEHARMARMALEGLPACSARDGLSNLVHYALTRQTEAA